MKVIGYQDQTNHQQWYVSDLPGHNGTTRIKQGPGRNSDWGFETNQEKAIPLTPYWQRRWMVYVKRDRNRSGGLQ